MDKVDNPGKKTTAQPAADQPAAKAHNAASSFESVGSATRRDMEGLSQGAGSVGVAMVDSAREIAEDVVNSTGSIASSGIKVARDTVKETVTAAQEIAGTASKAFPVHRALSETLTATRDVGGAAENVVEQLASGAIRTAGTIAGTMIETVRSLLITTVRSTKDVFGALLPAAKEGKHEPFGKGGDAVVK